MTSISRTVSRSLALLPIALVACMLFASTASALATRTWVSGIGDDGDPCSRTAPCKTLAGAISKTAAGGEINAMDSGGFGTVTINKSITIDLRGVQGSILNAFTTGIVINAPNANVTIRNLSINGGGIDPTPAPPACPYPANTSGIRVLQADTVRLQSVDITNQAVAGIKVDASTATPVITADDVSIHNICGPAIQATPTSPTSGTSLLLDRSSLTHAGTGILATGNVDVRVARSTIADTDTALSMTSPATIHSLGENLLTLNGVDGAFSSGLGGLDPTVNPTPVTVNPTPVNPTPVNPTPVTVQSVVQTVRELVVALADSEFEGVAGKPLKLRYVATAKGEATLTIRSGKKIVAELDAATVRGRNVFTWNGKLNGKAAAAGRYRIELHVLGTDGQSDADTAVVELEKPVKAMPGSANSKPKPARR